MSGLQVITRLREAGRTDLVIGLTGNALMADQQEYLHAGVDECAPPAHALRRY